MPTLEDRLAALERSVRRWRYATVGLVLVLAVGATVAAALQPEIPEVIKARKFQVVDDRGLPVVDIGAWQLGGQIYVYGKHTADKLGAVTTNIGHSDEGHGLVCVRSVAGKHGIVLCGSDGLGRGGRLQVHNKTGESVVTLGVDDYGNGEVGAWNRKGQGRTLTPGP